MFFQVQFDEIDSVACIYYILIRTMERLNLVKVELANSIWYQLKLSAIKF